MKILSVPFSGGGLGHGNGANKAPQIIIEQLKDCFANENAQTTNYTYDTIAVDESHIANSHQAIFSHMKKQKEKAILLGGDHSITYPAVSGLQKSNFVDDFYLVVFDAHPDLMDNFVPPTQEDYLKTLIEQEVLKPENVMLLGVRNWDKQEIEYLKEKNITCYTMKEIFDKGIQYVMSEVLKKINKPLYISLDIDVVDPVQAIGTGYLEHGGMSSRELIYCLQQLKKNKTIIMADIVEVNPSKDINLMTSKLAAKLITELGEF